LYVNELSLDVGEEGLQAIARLVAAGAPASRTP
jgi:predicted solute-binding protein